jgi:hypothetical protein
MQQDREAGRKRVDGKFHIKDRRKTAYIPNPIKEMEKYCGSI